MQPRQTSKTIVNKKDRTSLKKDAESKPKKLRTLNSPLIDLDNKNLKLKTYQTVSQSQQVKKNAPAAANAELLAKLGFFRSSTIERK